MTADESGMQTYSDAYADGLEMFLACGSRLRCPEPAAIVQRSRRRLDGGATLLVTDAADSLPARRADHRGWAVGLYPAGDAVGPSAYCDAEDGTPAGLLPVIQQVMQEHAARSSAVRGTAAPHWA